MCLVFVVCFAVLRVDLVYVLVVCGFVLWQLFFGLGLVADVG